MKKKEFIQLWYNLVNSEQVKKEFKQMVFGSHLKPYDGWRNLTAGENRITLEKNPAGYFIYNEETRFQLDKEEGAKMVYEYEKLLSE